MHVSRRAMLRAGGAAVAAAWIAPLSAARAAPACVVRPQQTEGPYFVDARLHRSDIRGEPSGGVVVEGVPLRLAFQVSRVTGSTCTPLPGAVIDVWQCDAQGRYSDVRDPRADTRGLKFLRGFQVTGADGDARFVTIYPGWYPGRTVHIHFKIRAASAGRGLEFTSQLYVDDALTDRVHAQAPYAAQGPRRQRNEDDGIFRNGGRQLMLPLARDGAGYAGTFEVGLSF
jgi:protocatechuate 3,4-dioxygenase beta subunit